MASISSGSSGILFQGQKEEGGKSRCLRLAVCGERVGKEKLFAQRIKSHFEMGDAHRNLIPKCDPG